MTNPRTIPAHVVHDYLTHDQDGRDPIAIVRRQGAYLVEQVPGLGGDRFPGDTPIGEDPDTVIVADWDTIDQAAKTAGVLIDDDPDDVAAPIAEALTAAQRS